MRLVVFCEQCRYEYGVVAYLKSNVEDGGLSKCPKCKERNRIAYILHGNAMPMCGPVFDG
ncbi:MAG: hypothetical protein KGI33_08105 [Thaumarchaeota archaeon]|nr:hypothetical protein [Nitrososphaerota archaeon]